MRSFFEDKQIVNPMNPDEVFTCQDLTEDYKICRKEKRMQTSAVGRKMNCTEYRSLGKSTHQAFNHLLFDTMMLMEVSVFVFTCSQ